MEAERPVRRPLSSLGQEMLVDVGMSQVNGPIHPRVHWKGYCDPDKVDPENKSCD